MWDGWSGGGASEATQACPQQRVLTFAALALVQLEGEDDVLFIAAELAHEAFRLAQLQNKCTKDLGGLAEMAGR